MRKFRQSFYKSVSRVSSSLEEAIIKMERNPAGRREQYPPLIQWCSDERSLNLGRRLHAHITSNGHDADTFIGNLLVDMYGKCGRVEEATKAFDAIAVPNAYSWTSIVAAFAQNGQSDEALDCFTRMWQMGLRPVTSILYIHLLRCCTVDDGRLLHGRISGQGDLDQKDVFVGTALMNMYASFDCIVDARRVFDRLMFKDQVAWTSMISAYARSKGSEKLALEVYHRMDVPADAITLAAVVDACLALVDVETGLLVHRRSQLEGFQVNGPCDLADHTFWSLQPLRVACKGNLRGLAKVA